MKKNQFVTEPGAFYLEAQLATGERDTQWVGYYEGADGGVGSDTIFVEIEGTGLVEIYLRHDD